MGEVKDLVARALEEEHAGESAATRRQFVGGALATLGSLGLLAAPGVASARTMSSSSRNSTSTILTVASTAEVLATIVNTVGYHRGLGGDPVTQRNVKAAAREELVHYNVLKKLGAQPATKKIWVPDAVFASRSNFLNTLQEGDSIFVNAYLVATEKFGKDGSGVLAITAAQFMGTEAVHRALARQSLGLLGNDRVFMKEHTIEHAPGAPNMGQKGFEDITVAVKQLEGAGFGFGQPGARPGRYFHFDEVKKRTPDDPALNTYRPEALTSK
jgi:hypothetical protein